MIDRRSLALGMAIGGKFNCEINMDYQPAAWNDTGVYDYFYLDYKRALGSFSYGRFRNASALVGTTGELIPHNAEQVSAGVYRIYADISREKQVRIFGTEGRGLLFSDGEPVPDFGTAFWVDAEEPYRPDYLYDAAALAAREPEVSEQLERAFFPMRGFGAYREEAALRVPQLYVAEQAAVEYW